LQTILTNIQKLKDKIKLLFLNIDDLKQKILDNETKINNNNKESQDIIAKLNDDLIDKNKFINENSINELKSKYASLQNNNTRLLSENKILNEKVTTSENILERFKSQLSQLTNNQAENIKNNKGSDEIINQITQIINNLNTDIDNHTSGSTPPTSPSSSENNGGIGTILENFITPSSSNDQSNPVFQQRDSYLNTVKQNTSSLKDSNLKSLQNKNMIGRIGGKKTKKNKKYTKKNKKTINKKKLTKKNKKSKKNYKKQKGGFIVTKTPRSSSSKKSTKKTTTSGNTVSSENPFSNISSMRGKKQKQKNKNNII
jgi:hypothetical protein